MWRLSINIKDRSAVAEVAGFLDAGFVSDVKRWASGYFT